MSNLEILESIAAQLNPKKWAWSLPKYGTCFAGGFNPNAPCLLISKRKWITFNTWRHFQFGNLWVGTIAIEGDKFHYWHAERNKNLDFHPLFAANDLHIRPMIDQYFGSRSIDIAHPKSIETMLEYITHG